MGILRGRTVRAVRCFGSAPARDLAAVLGVNANTVLRALRVLREEGLVELARRCGYQPQELAEIIEQVSVELR